jgi:hypothetical protein
VQLLKENVPGTALRAVIGFVASSTLGESSSHAPEGWAASRNKAGRFTLIPEAWFRPDSASSCSPTSHLADLRRRLSQRSEYTWAEGSRWAREALAADESVALFFAAPDQRNQRLLHKLHSDDAFLYIGNPWGSPSQVRHRHDDLR